MAAARAPAPAAGRQRPPARRRTRRDAALRALRCAPAGGRRRQRRGRARLLQRRPPPRRPSVSRPVNPQDRRANDRRRGDRRRSGASSAWNDDDTQAADSRFAQHEADADGGGSFARVVRLHAAARAAVGVGLVVAQGATVWLGSRGVPVAALLSVAYAAQAIVMWLLPRFLSDPRAGRRRRPPAGSDSPLLAGHDRRRSGGVFGVCTCSRPRPASTTRRCWSCRC